MLLSTIQKVIDVDGNVDSSIVPILSHILSYCVIGQLQHALTSTVTPSTFSKPVHLNNLLAESAIKSSTETAFKSNNMLLRGAAEKIRVTYIKKKEDLDAAVLQRRRRERSFRSWMFG